MVWLALALVIVVVLTPPILLVQIFQWAQKRGRPESEPHRLRVYIASIAMWCLVLGTLAYYIKSSLLEVSLVALPESSPSVAPPSAVAPSQAVNIIPKFPWPPVAALSFVTIPLQELLGTTGANADSSTTDTATNPATPTTANPSTTNRTTHPAAPTAKAVVDSSGKPAEVPQVIWDYALKTASELGKDKNFALLLCAVIKNESSFGADLSGNSPSVGDGLMQVEPASRQQFAGEFQSTYRHAYDNNSPQDQVRMGALALNDCIKKDGGDIQKALLHYNGGDDWTPETKDAYGRPVDAQSYSDYIYGIYKSYGGT